MKFPKMVPLAFVLFWILAPSTQGKTEVAKNNDLKKGLAAYKNGQYKKALRLFKDIVGWDKSEGGSALSPSGSKGQDPKTTWRAYQMLGKTFQRLGDGPNALKAYEVCLTLHPNDPEVKTWVSALKGEQNPTLGPTPGAKPVFQELDSQSEEGLPGADAPENWKVHDLPASLK